MCGYLLISTNSALTSVENKIPAVSSLVKKTDYNRKVNEIEKKVSDHNHDKYTTTPKFNSLAGRVFNARLARANLITKADFDVELKKISDRVTSNKSKNLLVETELKKLEKFDAAYFRGKNCFDGDGTQNYFNQYISILNEQTIIFLHGNQKGCLMKKLVLLIQYLIINLLQI